jgi:hypothetical protein
MAAAPTAAMATAAAATGRDRIMLIVISLMLSRAVVPFVPRPI